MTPYTWGTMSKNSLRAERRAPAPSRWPSLPDFLLAFACSWGAIAGLLYAVYHWQVSR